MGVNQISMIDEKTGKVSIKVYDLVEISEAQAKEKGKYRLEGKDYVMHDGDVVNFRFNV